MCDNVVIHNETEMGVDPKLCGIVYEFKQTFEQKYDKRLGEFHVYIKDNGFPYVDSVLISINGLLKPKFNILNISKGYLIEFDAEELKDTIAHEFSHIFNGDNEYKEKKAPILFIYTGLFGIVCCLIGIFKSYIFAAILVILLVFSDIVMYKIYKRELQEMEIRCDEEAISIGRDVKHYLTTLEKLKPYGNPILLIERQDRIRQINK
jgi:hypothetical protein